MSLESQILRVIAEDGQDSIAMKMRKDRSVISKYVNGNSGVMLADLEDFLGACGMRVVAADAPNISIDEVRALRVLARRALDADV